MGQVLVRSVVALLRASRLKARTVFTPLAAALAVVAGLFVTPVVAVATAGTASASSPVTTTYSAVETLPVPPSSNYQGSAGGDGWAVALSTTAVYNVFHHQDLLQVACHLQADATPCWSPETITDGSGDNFGVSGHPGLWLNQATGKLYLFANRTSDDTAGVVCIDTTIAATNTDPFCGFTALTGAGQASDFGLSAISDAATADGRWYAFNYFSGRAEGAGANQLLCFDLSTLAACTNQPYSLGVGTGVVGDGDFPPPGVAAFGDEVIVPVSLNTVSVNGSSDELLCFNAKTNQPCGGNFPLPLGFSYDSAYGTAYPLLSSSGSLLGFCLPTGPDPCYDLTGASVATPVNMTGAITYSSGWNGPAVVIGPRVYVPNGNYDTVMCFDYSTDNVCANFPFQPANLGLLYTVNPDPQRPTCLWVNSDDGSSQIQNFDAYTAGACGQGPIRVLASSIVAAGNSCMPTTYDSLQILQPAPGSYTSGTVQVEDGDANPIPGVPTLTLDGTGTVDLSPYSISPSGLPQFVITLNGTSGTPTSVEVKLTWTGTENPACVPTGNTESPTTVSTNLSGGGLSGATISVPDGTAVTDTASLSGTSAASAGGTVTYNVYSDANCTNLVQSAGTVNVTNGVVPTSSPVTLNSDGTYYWQANYSGDANNQFAVSSCGSEVETVASATAPVPTVTRVLPTQGPTFGTLAVAVLGSNLTAGASCNYTNMTLCSTTSVDFGATPATSILYASPTKLIVEEPPGALGTVDVTVGVGSQTSATSAADEFTYITSAIYTPAGLAARLAAAEAIVLTWPTTAIS